MANNFESSVQFRKQRPSSKMAPKFENGAQVQKRRSTSKLASKFKNGVQLRKWLSTLASKFENCVQLGKWRPSSKMAFSHPAHKSQQHKKKTENGNKKVDHEKEEAAATAEELESWTRAYYYCKFYLICSTSLSSAPSFYFISLFLCVSPLHWAYTSFLPFRLVHCCIVFSLWSISSAEKVSYHLVPTITTKFQIQFFFLNWARNSTRQPFKRFNNQHFYNSDESRELNKFDSMCLRANKVRNCGGAQTPKQCLFYWQSGNVWKSTNKNDKRRAVMSKKRSKQIMAWSCCMNTIQLWCSRNRT